MEYQSPGSAFSNAMEQHMLQEAALKRQALMDKIAQQREDRQAKAQADDLQLRREEMEGRRAEFHQTLGEKKTAALNKRIGEMVPGDIPDREMLDQADELGIGGQNFPKPKESMPGIAAVPVGQEQVGLTPSSDASVRPFIGTREDRRKKDQEAKVNAIRDRIATLEPNSPDYKRALIDYEMLTNKTIPAGLAKGGSDGTPVIRQNAKSGVVERLLNGQWTLVTGDVPQGSHFMTEPQPKDTSAGDAARAQREDRRLDSVQQHIVTELNDMSKTLESSMKDYDRLGILLNQHTAQADAEAAILVLKATAGGEGSGLRINHAEIDNTLKGRTRWEDLEAAMKKWSLDPQTATIPDTQRSAMRDLGRLIRSKTYTMHKRITDTRLKVVDSEDVKEIKRMGAELRNDLYAADSELDKGTVPAPISKRIVYDMNGNPVKQ